MCPVDIAFLDHDSARSLKKKIIEPKFRQDPGLARNKIYGSGKSLTSIFCYTSRLFLSY